MASTTCYIHPKKAANTTCERCEQPICPEDHRTVTTTSGFGNTIFKEKKRVCPDCKVIIQDNQKRRIRRNMIIGFIAISSIGVIFYVLWNSV